MAMVQSPQHRRFDLTTAIGIMTGAMLSSQQREGLLRCAERRPNIPNDVIVPLLRAGYVGYDDNDALRITPKGLQYLRSRVTP